jgi:hypothetical protein
VGHFQCQNYLVHYSLSIIFFLFIPIIDLKLGATDSSQVKITFLVVSLV